MTRTSSGRRFDALWGALGVIALLAGWSWIHHASGPFVMPSLIDTAAAGGRLIRTGVAWTALQATLLHALGGLAVGAVIGGALGALGGVFRPVGAALTPAATAILGTPPIAWVVLTLLWFGPGDLGALITVALAIAPILFAAALVGVRRRDPQLEEMARLFRLSWRTRLLRLWAPQLGLQLIPALSTSFALAWKVALTAEVLGDGSGVGGRFATARAHLDLAEAMAWLCLLLAFLLVSESLALGPLRKQLFAAAAPPRKGAGAPQADGPRCVGLGALKESG